jgi:hypothetical protein
VSLKEDFETVRYDIATDTGLTKEQESSLSRIEAKCLDLEAGRDPINGMTFSQYRAEVSRLRMALEAIAEYHIVDYQAIARRRLPGRP